VLLAIYLLGCQLAAWLAWPIPGGVIGLALLLLAFATGWSNRRPCNWAPDC
jgi:holin-like protein